MKKHFKLIVFILAILLLTTLYVIGKSTENLVVGLIFIIGVSLFVTIMTLLQALSYRKAKNWLYMSISFVILISYIFFNIKGIFVAFDRDPLIKERESLMEQLDKETNQLQKDELHDKLFEIWIEMNYLDSEIARYLILENLSIVILAFMPSPKKKDDKTLILDDKGED